MFSLITIPVVHDHSKFNTKAQAIRLFNPYSSAFEEGFYYFSPPNLNCRPFYSLSTHLANRPQEVQMAFSSHKPLTGCLSFASIILID